MVTNDALEGKTLIVYAYIVRADEPVGAREVTRAVNFSSASVAHYHLQKLETLGLIEKNSYGKYTIRKKVSVGGYVWVGRSLVPRLMFYSFFFIGAFAAEVGILLLSLVVVGFVVEVSFLFLTGMTFVATLLFVVESLALYRKLNPKPIADDDDGE